MNGMICCVCSMLAFSALTVCAVLRRWQKEYNKIQEKKESQRSRQANDEPYCKWRPSNSVIFGVRKAWGEKSYWKSESLGVRKLEKEDRTGRPVVGSDPITAPGYYQEQFTVSSFSARYSRWDGDKAWSSQEWKADKSMDDGTGQPVVISWWKPHDSQSSFFHEKTHHDGTSQSVVNDEKPHDRTEQPVVIPQREIRPQQFVIGNDETESEFSVESRSFLSRVNDQVRKRQKQSSMDIAENDEKHSMIWGMFMSVTLESAVFMGKNYLDTCHSITNTKDHTLKQMFDISARLVSEQDEISGLETIGWENHSWKYMSLICDERVINLQRTKVHVFSDSVLCLGEIL